MFLVRQLTHEKIDLNSGQWYVQAVLLQMCPECVCVRVCVWMGGCGFVRTRTRSPVVAHRLSLSMLTCAILVTLCIKGQPNQATEDSSRFQPTCLLHSMDGQQPTLLHGRPFLKSTSGGRKHCCSICLMTQSYSRSSQLLLQK